MRFSCLELIRVLHTSFQIVSRKHATYTSRPLQHDSMCANVLLLPLASIVLFQCTQVPLSVAKTHCFLPVFEFILPHSIWLPS